MNRVEQGLIVGILVLVMSFPLKAVVPEDLLIWALAAVAGASAWCARCFAERKNRK